MSASRPRKTEVSALKGIGDRRGIGFGEDYMKVSKLSIAGGNLIIVQISLHDFESVNMCWYAYALDWHFER